MIPWNTWAHEVNGYNEQKGCKSCSPWPWGFVPLFSTFMELHPSHQPLWCIVNDRERDKDKEKRGRHGTFGYNCSVSWVLHLDVQQILFPLCMSSIDSLRFVIFWSLSSSKPSFYSFFLFFLFFLASSSSFHTCSYQRLSLFIISTLYLYGLRGLWSPKGISWCHCI